MFKRIISLLCVLCVSMGLINIHSVFASDTVLSAVSDNTAYKVGDKVNVKFDISNNQGFSALQFDIDFDSSKLKYVSHEFGSIKGSGFFDAQVNENNIIVSTMDFMSNISGNGTVITVTFEAIANGTSNIGISNEVMSAIDDNSVTGTVKLNLTTSNTTISVLKDDDNTTTEMTTKAPVTTTEKQTEVTTKTPVTTTEKQTEATTKATITTTENTTKAVVIEDSSETTTRKVSSVSSGGGAGASSIKVNGYTLSTITTEASTEATTKIVKSEIITETTTEKAVSVNDVKVTIGKKTVMIGENEYTVDAAPYIQSSSNSTLVPLRFVALAIADGDVNDADNSDSIVWDSATKTATIIFDDKTIEFTVGSYTMIIDGKPQTMENGVKAEITEGRMFVPFRALGNALGVTVDWDTNTKTATYKSK